MTDDLVTLLVDFVMSGLKAEAAVRSSGSDYAEMATALEEANSLIVHRVIGCPK
jgi:hypothetical protein